MSFQCKQGPSPVHRRVVLALVTLFVMALASPAFGQGLPTVDDLDEPPEEEEVEETQPEEEEEAEEPADENATADEAETEETTPATEDGDEAAPAETTETEAGAAASMEAGEAPDEEEKDERYVSPGVNLEGSVGLQHMAAAWGGPANTYRIALLGELSSSSDTIRFQDSNTFFAGNLVFEASPVEYFSANVRLKTRNNVNSFGRPEAMLSQGDLLLAGKGYYPVTEVLNIGGDLSLYFPSEFGDSGIGFSGTSVRPRLIASVDVSKLADQNIDLQGHFNFGYRVDNTENLVPDGVEPTRVERFAYDVSAYDYLELGLGFEYDFPYISPFLAWNLSIPVNGADGICGSDFACASDAGFGSFPNLLTLGAKAEPIDHLGIHAGLDLSLTSDDARGVPATLPYNVILGLSWEIDPTPPVQYVEKVVEKKVSTTPPEGYIQGTIVDQNSGETVEGAVIAYPKTGDTPQSTSDQGIFRSYGFAPGKEIGLEIKHPDYKPATRTLQIEEGEQTMKVELEPLPRQAFVEGKVTAEDDSIPSDATVRLVGEEETYNTSLGLDGSFKQEVKAGDYTVSVSAPGYITTGRDFSIEPDDTENLQFTLREAPEEKAAKLRDDKIQVQAKIQFETSKATLLGDSHPILDQVAAIMFEYPTIELRVEGHTDDAGADDFNMELSQKRAEAVRSYLIQRGVSADRLVAKGFGETRPILPNTSKRNRAINRRVEFRRTDEEAAR